jgi:hypothetical protein
MRPAPPTAVRPTGGCQISCFHKTEPWLANWLRDDDRICFGGSRALQRAVLDHPDLGRHACSVGVNDADATPRLLHRRRSGSESAASAPGSGEPPSSSLVVALCAGRDDSTFGLGVLSNGTQHAYVLILRSAPAVDRAGSFRTIRDGER